MLMRLYLIARKILNPLAYLHARITFYNCRMPRVWSEVIELGEREFQAKLGSYPWLSDPLHGVWDFTPVNANLFFCDKPEFPWFSERRWGRDCLPGFETVYANKGVPKRIDELEDGDEVLSYNFVTRKQEYRKISIWRSGKKEMYEARFLNGNRSFSSKEHKFFTYENSSKREYVPVSLENIFSRVEGKRKVDSWKRKVPTIKKALYTETDVEWLNEDLCFVFGYYLSEGWREKTTLRMGARKIPRLIVPLLEANGIPYNLVYRKSDELPILTLLKTDTKFHDLLQKAKTNASDMHIEDFLYRLPRNKLRRFLEGCFQGDGHFVDYGRGDERTKVYSTASDELKNYLMDISFKLGNPLNVYLQKDSQGAGKNPLPIWRLTDNPNSFFKKDYGYDSLSETSLVSAESTGQMADMWDIEVEGNHNFFLASSGTLVHNCDEWADLTYRWARHRKFPAWIIGLWDAPWRNAHFICVYHDGLHYVLADYGIRGRVDSLKEAVELMRFNTWLWTNYERLDWMVYHRGGEVRV